MNFHHNQLQLYDRETRRLYINADERARILAALPRKTLETQLLCKVLMFSGCRISEALALQPASVDSVDRLIAVRTIKKRGLLHVREIPVPGDLATAILRYCQARDLDERDRLFPIHRMTAWRRIKQIMLEVGVQGPQATPKGLRHGFGVHAIRSGVPLNLLRKWMGHVDISTTAIYANALGPEEREIASRMW